MEIEFYLMSKAEFIEALLLAGRGTGRATNEMNDGMTITPETVIVLFIFALIIAFAWIGIKSIFKKG